MTQFRRSQFCWQHPEHYNREPTELMPSSLHRALWGCGLWPHQCRRVSSQPVRSGAYWPWYPHEHKWVVFYLLHGWLVLRGNLMMTQWSSLFLLGTFCRGSLGCLWSLRVLSQKVDDIRIFFLWPWVPFSTAFLVFRTFTLASTLGEAGISFFASSAILVKGNSIF